MTKKSFFSKILKRFSSLEGCKQLFTDFENLFFLISLLGKKGKERYLLMQKNYYKRFDGKKEQDRSDCIGCLPENMNHNYKSYLLSKCSDKKNLATQVALDFGCGPGRMIEQLSEVFARVDGVDINPSMLAAAKRLADEKGFKSLFFETNGQSIENIDKQEYDFIYSTICMQHICVHEIRNGLFTEFYRILKSDGRIAVQLAYTEYEEAFEQHARWGENRYNVLATNSAHDVLVTSESIPDILSDLMKIGFVDLSYVITEPPLRVGYYTGFIYVYGMRPGE
jgi:SAM-dependent methyltransferase